MKIKDLPINISDCKGELRDLDEILYHLDAYTAEFNTTAMSDHQLFLQGKKEMLCEIIEYLRRCI